MSEVLIELINKRGFEYKINYPGTLENGRENPSYVFPEAKNGKTSSRKVPLEVFNWLKDYTTTFTQGFLEIVETEENKYDVEDIIEKNKAVCSAIYTEKEIEEMINKGNHLTFGKRLNEISEKIQDLDEDAQIQVKDYVWKTCVNLGIDSNAKIKKLCEWTGRDYDSVKDLFDVEN